MFQKCVIFFIHTALTLLDRHETVVVCHTGSTKSRIVGFPLFYEEIRSVRATEKKYTDRLTGREPPRVMRFPSLKRF